MAKKTRGKKRSRTPLVQRGIFRQKVKDSSNAVEAIEGMHDLKQTIVPIDFRLSKLVFLASLVQKEPRIALEDISGILKRRTTVPASEFRTREIQDENKAHFFSSCSKPLHCKTEVELDEKAVKIEVQSIPVNCNNTSLVKSESVSPSKVLHEPKNTDKNGKNNFTTSSLQRPFPITCQPVKSVQLTSKNVTHATGTSAHNLESTKFDLKLQACSRAYVKLSSNTKAICEFAQSQKTKMNQRKTDLHASTNLVRKAKLSKYACSKIKLQNSSNRSSINSDSENNLNSADSQEFKIQVPSPNSASESIGHPPDCSRIPTTSCNNDNTWNSPVKMFTDETLVIDRDHQVPLPMVYCASEKLECGMFYLASQEGNRLQLMRFNGHTFEPYDWSNACKENIAEGYL